MNNDEARNLLRDAYHLMHEGRESLNRACEDDYLAFTFTMTPTQKAAHRIVQAMGAKHCAAQALHMLEDVIEAWGCGEISDLEPSQDYE